jgi:hypothetical protein
VGHFGFQKLHGFRPMQKLFGKVDGADISQVMIGLAEDRTSAPISGSPMA